MKSPQMLPLLAAIAVGLLAGCAATSERMRVPEQLSLSPHATEATEPSLVPEEVTVSRTMRESQTPQRPMHGRDSAGLQARDVLPVGLGSKPVSVNVENLPIPAFANEVFGNLLGLSFQLDSSVGNLSELVTLRTATPQTPADLFRLARQVLGEYGIDVSVEGDIVRVRLAPEGSRVEPPLILSGRALPDVPVSHRPVFHLVELEVTRANEANRWLRTVYGNDLTIEEDLIRNALLISGRPEQVRQALDALKVFDRPFMRGRASIRLEPAFMSAEELAARLSDVLTAEGYGASRAFGVPASVLILPMPSVNAVIVFAADRAILNHAVAWARQIDRANPAAGSQSLFYYQVKNTKASDIAGVLGGASAARASQSGTTVAAAAQAGGEQAAQPRAASQRAGYSLIVDEPRNALIFQGDPAEWERLLPLVRQMDRAARQVMIEVTIAEVSLDDNQDFGVAWFAKAGFDRFNGGLSYGNLSGSGSPGSGSGGNGGSGGTAGSSGLTYLLDVAGQSRAALRAFAEDQRVNILSTPRLLVKSGEEANIDVGTEVPTITAQTTSNQQTGGNTNLLQSIQYRKTGIILNIRPTVYSDDRIDLDIRQEVSEALPLGSDSTIGSPSIFNRSVSTSLSLRDGGSIVIAGLMSQRHTRSESGVPGLKNVPVLGNLFKSQSRRSNKTELVLMIVPYIVGSDERAQDITRSIGEQLELLDLPVPADMNPAVHEDHSRQDR